ncbi:hypothetical protein K3555_13445 [Leisingera sp. M527]|uniref:hypothetical protein n=1 Tax=Leisingera sp. M527 TaxID=2867014 RepID=UPI0021A65227|nr:hypothetical protein [Leisingera sp. M527]UWQ31598.1 hypothetical protein K3555_13445 [Leisingera sp. M527]
MDAENFTVVAHFTVATLPLLIGFILAMRDIVLRAPSNATFPPFANRWTGYCGAWIVVLLIAYCCAWITFTYGGCSGGIKHSAARCYHIPNAAAQYASFIMFFGFIYLVSTLMPAFVILTATEAAYRLRKKRVTGPRNRRPPGPKRASTAISVAIPASIAYPRAKQSERPDPC